MKNSSGKAQIASRRNHVDMISLGASFTFHFRDGHFACSGKQLRQMALLLGIEVLNQHECHAGIVRQMAEQLRECLQSAGGGAYADNGRGTAFGPFLGGWPHHDPGGNRTCGCRGGLHIRDRLSLWAGRATRTRRTRDFTRPTTAGLLCQTSTFTFLAGTTSVIHWNGNATYTAREVPLSGWVAYASACAS